jgi:SAM-dependent methyltransferase
VSAAWDEVANLYGVAHDLFRAFPARLSEYAAVEPGEQVVDLGSGNGLGTATILRSVAPRLLASVDFSREMLRSALRRTSSSEGGTHHLCADVRALPFRTASFDVAFASTVFQFVHYSVDVLREWKRVLRPSGRLVYCVPLPSGDGPDVNGTLISEYFGRLSVEARARLLADGPPPPVPDLAEVTARAGYTDVEVVAEEFDARIASADEWWAIQWTHGFRVFLREFDSETLDEMRTRAFELLEPLRDASGAIAGAQAFAYVRARA